MTQVWISCSPRDAGVSHMLRGPFHDASVSKWFRGSLRDGGESEW